MLEQVRTLSFMCSSICQTQFDHFDPIPSQCSSEEPVPWLRPSPYLAVSELRWDPNHVSRKPWIPVVFTKIFYENSHCPMINHYINHYQPALQYSRFQGSMVPVWLLRSGFGKKRRTTRGPRDWNPTVTSVGNHDDNEMLLIVIIVNDHNDNTYL